MDSTRTPVAPAQYGWLQRESARWEQAGLVEAGTSQRLLDLYSADVSAARKAGVTRLLLGGGLAFVGVGLFWLVAANLDQLPPLARWITVLVLWVAALVGAEALAARRTAGHRVPPALVGGMRLLAALLVGGVIFQAAQSLQVPAYEPKLVGLWAVGALAQAYAVRGILPLLVGIAAAQVYTVWQVAENEPSGLGVVLAFGLLAVGYVSVAALHDDDAFGRSWRFIGVLTGLVALFAAAIPDVDADDFALDWPLVLLGAVAGVLALLALVRGSAQRLEVAGAATLVVIAALLVLWEAGDRPDAVGPEDWAHALVSVAVYVVAALGVAALGIRHDFAPLTWLATAALVVFTTFQSFAVFGQIVQGGVLFVLLGLVLVGTGFGFDRARRELAEVIA